MFNSIVLCRQKLLLLMMSCFICSSSFAAFQLLATRVILSGDKKEGAISIRNVGEHPALIQAWSEDEDSDEVKKLQLEALLVPSLLDKHKDQEQIKAYSAVLEEEKLLEEQEKVSYIVTPPLVRIEKKDDAVLRIVRVGGTPPDDREAMSWLSVREIPKKSQAENVLIFSVTSKIKVFDRPKGLSKKSGIAQAEAYKKLRWEVKKIGKTFSLQAHNPTPYYITIVSLKLNDGADEVQASEMVPPFSNREYPVDNAKIKHIKNLSYHTINDYGGDTEDIKVPL